MSFTLKSLGFFGVFALVCGMADSALSETIVHKSVAYFTITGSTAAELDRQLNSNGPHTTTTGLRHPGATQIKFGGDVTYVEKGGRCSVGSARVTLKTHIILPQWKNRNRADKDLPLIWDTLAADIKRHEERHAEIARNHARDMEQAFLKLGSQKNCAAMQAMVARTSKAAIEAHDKDQLRFDKVEAANFDNRMYRILRQRLQTRENPSK